MKPVLNPYLVFNGNCREAMEFYRSVLGGRLYMQTFEESGMPASADQKNKIIHAVLRNDLLTFMASDSMPEQPVKTGNNISMSINGSDEKTLTEFFKGLSKGGKVNMPMEKQFWGDKFGALTDKFGISWMVNISTYALVISRIFDAPRKSVWKAWTDPEMVMGWWGPKDFTSPSCRIDLKVGGKYIFCMHGPKGSEFDRDLYSSGVYKEIVPQERLVVTDYFSDENGNKIDPATVGMNPEMPGEMEVVVMFENAGENKTKLTINYPHPETDTAYEAMSVSGMEAGWNESLDKLAKFLLLANN